MSLSSAVKEETFCSCSVVVVVSLATSGVVGVVEVFATGLGVDWGLVLVGDVVSTLLRLLLVAYGKIELEVVTVFFPPRPIVCGAFVCCCCCCLLVTGAVT